MSETERERWGGGEGGLCEEVVFFAARAAVAVAGLVSRLQRAALHHKQPVRRVRRQLVGH